MSKCISVKDGKLIKRHEYILKKLATSNSKNRKRILSNAPNELFHVLMLIFKLLESDKFKLSNKRKTKINSHKQLIKSTSKLNHQAIKRKLTNQRGGSLSKILSTILPVILGTAVKALL